MIEGRVGHGQVQPGDYQEKGGESVMDQRQLVPQPRSMEQENRRPVLRSGSNVCDLVWQNGTAYCEFQGPGISPFRVQAKDVLEALHKMTRAQ